MKLLKGLFILVPLILSAFYAIEVDRALTAEPNTADAHQNLLIAYNLAYRGAFSTARAERESPSPTNYREPLPPFLMALHIKSRPHLAEGLTDVTLNQGEAVRTLKRHNTLWAFICLAGVAILTLALTRGSWPGGAAAIAAVMMSYAFFVSNPNVTDRLYTEIQSASLLIWSSLIWLFALRGRNLAWFALGGVGLGALALTKAFYLYVGIAFLIALLVSALIHRRRATGVLLGVAIAAGGMAATTVPWMVRNYVVMDSFDITQRGSRVLYARAYKNTKLVDDEYIGAYYAYSRGYYRQIIGDFLGYTRDDLLAGGRLQRINRHSNPENDLAAQAAGRPEDAITYFRQFRADRTRRVQEYRSQGLGLEAARLAVEADLHREAIQIIADDPIQHLKTSILFLWRGTNFHSLPLLLMAAIGLLWFRPSLIALAVVPAGAIAMMALSTHFIIRYGWQFIPSMSVAVCLLIVWLAAFLWAQSSFSRRSAEQALV